MALFLFLGQIPRAPNFAEFHARGGGGRLPVMPRDLIPPRGRTLLHGEAGKPTSAVGVSSPKAVPRRGGGLTFGRRAAHGGWFRRRAGQPSGVRAAHGGQRRARAGEKAAHAGASRVPGVCAGAGVPGKTGASRVSIRARAGQKTGGAGAKRGVRAGKRRGWRALGAQKAPFFAPNGAGGGLCGRETGGKSWRRV